MQVQKADADFKKVIVHVSATGRTVTLNWHTAGTEERVAFEQQHPGQHPSQLGLGGGGMGQMGQYPGMMGGNDPRMMGMGMGGMDQASQIQLMQRMQMARMQQMQVR